VRETILIGAALLGGCIASSEPGLRSPDPSMRLQALVDDLLPLVGLEAARFLDARGDRLRLAVEVGVDGLALCVAHEICIGVQLRETGKGVSKLEI
jgi:hypothetical protein